MSGSARNQGLSRLPGREQIGKEPNPTITSKQNYSAVKYGTDKGSIKFGHIHKKADVTAGVMLDTPDGRHSLFLDVDGQRKGWTSSISPGNFQVLAGEDNTEISVKFPNGLDSFSPVRPIKNRHKCVSLAFSTADKFKKA